MQSLLSTSILGCTPRCVLPRPQSMEPARRPPAGLRRLSYGKLLVVLAMIMQQRDGETTHDEPRPPSLAFAFTSLSVMQSSPTQRLAQEGRKK